MAYWVAIYKDGSTLDSREKKYTDIDRSKLIAIDVIRDEQPTRLHLGPGKKLIMRRKGIFDIISRTGEGTQRKFGVWAVGWESGKWFWKRQCVAFVWEEYDRVEIVDNWGTHRPIPMEIEK